MEDTGLGLIFEECMIRFLHMPELIGNKNLFLIFKGNKNHSPVSYSIFFITRY